jgi:methionyl-tRNA formyltransferase
MNVVVVGEESAGLQTLKILARRVHRVVAVLTSREGSRSTPLRQFAIHMGYVTLPAERVKDPAFAGFLRQESVDLLLNVHSLHIIHPDILSAPKIGAFNMHPGPLPRYAGLNAPSWAIYHGEKWHGVTIHRMVPKIDAGEIVLQDVFAIADDDTGLSLSLKCVKAGLLLMEQLLAIAAADPRRIPLAPQDRSRREYFGRQVPHDGCISWSMTAAEIVNFVRACDYLPFPSPWGQPMARTSHTAVALIKARRTGEPCTAPPGTVAAGESAAVRVAARDEWVSLSRVRVEGQYHNAADVLRPGEVLQDGYPGENRT